MPLYNEHTSTTTITTTTFDRANKVDIDNPLNGTPSIRFREETVQRRDGNDTVLGPKGFLEESLTEANSTEEYNLIDPATGDILGVTTYHNLFLQLYSLYFHLGTKRDNQE